MNKSERQLLLTPIKYAHAKYLDGVSENHNLLLEKRFKNLYIKLRTFSRSSDNSSNNLKQIPRIAHIIFGLVEDIKRCRLPEYDFGNEIILLCKFIKLRTENNIASGYNGKLRTKGQYGEIILNCYLDLIITFTTYKTVKEIEAHPVYLVNSLTSEKMELDVLFDGFKIAFEFQGEHHYKTNVDGLKTQARDNEKFLHCAREHIMLIPVNAFQLSSDILFPLIANSVKDYLGLGEITKKLISNKENVESASCRKRDLSNYFKLLQRLTMAKMLFAPIITDLDIRSERYIQTQKGRQPITCTTPAPRAAYSGLDFKLIELYRVIPQLAKIGFKDSNKI